ncbi:alpha/beta fold hydrolase [Clostridioides difficile]
MFWRAKSGCVSIDDTDMDYIHFGNGNNILIMLPGLGDGLTTVKRMAIAMAMAYRMYAKDYKVYVFSRKNQLHDGYSTRDMAKDQAKAMKLLGINKAKILGISQGGMIAQYLAIDYPDLVEKLILAVTLSKQNKNIQEVVRNWIALAEQENYKQLMIDTSEKSYSENYLKKYRLLYPLLGKVGKPKDFSRFLIQAASCIQHDAYTELDNIVCPTLVIGGANDKIVGATSFAELADKIKDSELFIYKDFGHAAYEEAKDFNSRVLYYLSK